MHKPESWADAIAIVVPDFAGHGSSRTAISTLPSVGLTPFNRDGQVYAQ